MYQKSAISKKIHFSETFFKHSKLYITLFVSFTIELVAFQPYIKLVGQVEHFCRILEIIKN